MRFVVIYNVLLFIRMKRCLVEIGDIFVVILHKKVEENRTAIAVPWVKVYNHTIISDVNEKAFWSALGFASL